MRQNAALRRRVVKKNISTIQLDNPRAFDPLRLMMVDDGPDPPTVRPHDTLR
jgi:hypothetical protein